MPSENLQARVPVVVPAPFGFEGINAFDLRPLSAEVGHRLLDRAAVAATHIAHHTIDIEQQQAGELQGEVWVVGLVG